MVGDKDAAGDGGEESRFGDDRAPQQDDATGAGQAGAGSAAAGADEPVQPAGAQAGDSGWAAGDQAEAAHSAAIEAEIVELRQQNAELRDRLLRTVADMENLRKRTEKEKADLRKFAISEFARDVLSIGDNIQRALDHVPEDAAERDPALKSFREGVQLLERELLAVLERHGVRRIVPDLEPFNPHLHQAVMEEQNPAVPAGTVLQVFQAGFIIDERCLRPAMVSVSRGGPKPAKPEAQVGAADTQGPTDGAGLGEPGAGEGGAETG